MIQHFRMIYIGIHPTRKFLVVIYAELQYDEHYSEVHAELVDYLKSKFPNLESGLQGDSWIWIFEGDEKVAIDSFSSMKHQIKSSSPQATLVHKVIDVLSSQYSVEVYEKPELEPHDE